MKKFLVLCLSVAVALSLLLSPTAFAALDIESILNGISTQEETNVVGTVKVLAVNDSNYLVYFTPADGLVFDDVQFVVDNVIINEESVLTHSTSEANVDFYIILQRNGEGHNVYVKVNVTEGDNLGWQQTETLSVDNLLNGKLQEQLKNLVLYVTGATIVIFVIYCVVRKKYKRMNAIVAGVSSLVKMTDKQFDMQKREKNVKKKDKAFSSYVFRCELTTQNMLEKLVTINFESAGQHNVLLQNVYSLKCIFRAATKCEKTMDQNRKRGFTYQMKHSILPKLLETVQEVNDAVERHYLKYAPVYTQLNEKMERVEGEEANTQLLEDTVFSNSADILSKIELDEEALKAMSSKVKTRDEKPSQPKQNVKNEAPAQQPLMPKMPSPRPPRADIVLPTAAKEQLAKNKAKRETTAVSEKTVTSTAKAEPSAKSETKQTKIPSAVKTSVKTARDETAATRAAKVGAKPAAKSSTEDGKPKKTATKTLKKLK